NLEIELPVRTVFEAPTITALAHEVEQAKALGLKAHTPILQRRPRASAEANREELLARLGTLSATELQSVLQRVLDGAPPSDGTPTNGSGAS
ncbi:MAG TPA: hypothetical protein VGS05_07495, partial [Candidatus Sulfotelmatobacter sp.]|nr:hypothetical protein [Candidatus Sulfotelmatobacter sp.]